MNVVDTFTTPDGQCFSVGSYASTTVTFMGHPRSRSGMVERICAWNDDALLTLRVITGQFVTAKATRCRPA